MPQTLILEKKCFSVFSFRFLRLRIPLQPPPQELQDFCWPTEDHSSPGLLYNIITELPPPTLHHESWFPPGKFSDDFCNHVTPPIVSPFFLSGCEIH
ncbi:hypothetical protein MDA_GLEAN10010990 [Myotis davidii]|uniref:Uncharacterized protein n=1 Tax=Myotis davidii TaxID=225400 RepID=L5LLJ9_MYODS|nr:hypothetical protein MDA_GLEAN10010990 [Myotis davidii]